MSLSILDLCSLFSKELKINLTISSLKLSGISSISQSLKYFLMVDLKLLINSLIILKSISSFLISIDLALGSH